MADNAARAGIHAEQCADLQKLGLWKVPSLPLPVLFSCGKEGFAKTVPDFVDTTNLPLEIVDSEAFHRFVTELNPGSQPLSSLTFEMLIIEDANHQGLDCSQQDTSARPLEEREVETGS